MIVLVFLVLIEIKVIAYFTRWQNYFLFVEQLRSELRFKKKKKRMADTYYGKKCDPERKENI